MDAQLIVSIVLIGIILHVLLGSVAYGILLERKIASWIQDRIGPNRAGPYGLLQPIADGAKFMFKEDYTPANADKALFTLAPMIAAITAMLGWAVIPWGGYFLFPEVNIPEFLPLIGGLTIESSVVSICALPINVGVIYILAVGSLAVYGVVLAGYASNNKFAFFGGLRATAQMLSYEIPMGLALLMILLLAGTPSAPGIISQQAYEGLAAVDLGIDWLKLPNWFMLYHPFLAILFFVCVLAECNRTPFDLAEAESELVGGYHTEYSSMRFALFFLGEYIHMITGCAFFTLLFLGGWDLGFIDLPAVGLTTIGGVAVVLIKVASFSGKVFILMSLMMVLRWTLPRFRFDQLMKLGWQTLIPMTLVILLGSGIVSFLKLSWVGELVALLSLNLVVFFGAAFIGPLLPKGENINRKVPLAGSRFNPPVVD